MTRLGWLLATQRITAGEWQAGYCYARDYVVGVHGARLGEGEGGGHGCPTTARLDAMTRFSRARNTLSLGERDLMDALAEDLPWSEIARQARCTRHEVVTRSTKALAHLSRHYATHGARSAVRTLHGTAQDSA